MVLENICMNYPHFREKMTQSLQKYIHRYTMSEEYNMKKEGKLNILLYKDREYKIGDTFIHDRAQFQGERHLTVFYGTITKITPKQVHFTLQTNPKTIVRKSTKNFIDIIKFPKTTYID